MSISNIMKQWANEGEKEIDKIEREIEKVEKEIKEVEKEMDVHPRIKELEELLYGDDVPIDKLRDAFILVNREVMKQPELLEIMAAEHIGLVTKTAEKLLDVKLATKKEKKKKEVGDKKVGAKKALASMIVKTDEEEDWS